MSAALTITELESFLMALLYAQPRVLAMFALVPIFNAQIIPGMLRTAVAMGLTVLVAPHLMPSVTFSQMEATQIILILVKESFLGFVLGFFIAVPFWAFEAVGFFVDNQRGASIAATLNPLTGNDTSPLGILFNQAFIVFFFISGGFLVMLDLLYDSYRLWPVFTFVPQFDARTVPLLLGQLDRVVSLMVLLSAPVIVAMFLAEMGLALVSRFVPQLQVFFLAMPIKSALAMLILMLYAATLFDYGLDHIRALRDVVPFLDGQWRGAPAGGAR